MAFFVYVCIINQLIFNKMKNTSLLIVFFLLNISLSFAQNLEKIKGDRNVSIVETTIDAFHTISLNDDFNIEIIYNNTPSVEIETDENLHDVIKFEVIDSVLTFNKTARITSKKRLHIKVAYNKSLKLIETTDDSEILSLATMDLKHFILKAKGSSKVGLTIESDHFSFDGDDKSKVNLNVTSQNCTINMSGYSKLEALINTTQFSSNQLQRAINSIEGSCDIALLDLDNNTQFNGKNFTINTCNIICNIDSEANLEVLENITIEASGASSISLYENPKIVITKLTDTSKLQKKVK
jgi:hypothetical protein